ncbi:MAG: asparagine synthase (glutamine-hydrolyzing) [bacterium]|nr:asparagine synthase (glutamine-hydrolyzing) [bacterium]
MCGIAGIWGEVSQERLQAMADALRHRGPDDEGFWFSVEHRIGLANRRLAIIDLPGGRQPIANEDGKIVTVLNGEIYNYRELRAELVGRGHRFRTNTDTETIVHLYEEHGIRAVERMRGMFAIAIWDENERRLVLFRDRAGKKPLYYMETQNGFAFASEIKALVAAHTAPLELDQQALADYLTWMAIPASATIYRQVRAVQPAEVVVVRDRRIAQRGAYWQLDMSPKQTLDFDEAVDRVDAELREAVSLRLRSDVPVGVFLSGGLDSGLVTALAAQASADPLTTITVGFEDAAHDERPLARRVAEQYGTRHQEVLVKPDLEDVLPKIAAAYDQPFADSSAIPSYYAAQAAREHVKVVLNGDGGDEVFCGYRRYLAGRLAGRLRAFDGVCGRALWGMTRAALPTPRRTRTPYAFAHRFIRGMGLPPAERHLAWNVDGFTPSELRKLLQPDVWSSIVATAGARHVAELHAGLEAAGAVDRMLAVDFATSLPNELLVKMDIASMAHGLEARSPMLDHVLIDAASHYPESVRLAGRQTKPLLRALGQRYLPTPILTAPKRGFEVPLVRWLREDLRTLRDDLLLQPTGLVADICQRPYLERLVRGKTRLDPRRWSTRVWMLMMLALWDRHVRPNS